MFRQFFSKNIKSQAEEDGFDKTVQEAFKDYNLAMQGKDNFISDHMEELERMVDKTSLFKTESKRKLFFPDLDQTVKEEMEAAEQEKE